MSYVCVVLMNINKFATYIYISKSRTPKRYCLILCLGFRSQLTRGELLKHYYICSF